MTERWLLGLLAAAVPILGIVTVAAGIERLVESPFPRMLTGLAIMAIGVAIVLLGLNLLVAHLGEGRK